MTRRSVLTEFRVGVFVTTGIALAMLVIFMVGSEHQFFQQYYTLYANFKSISGLSSGAPVQLAGMKVGYVDEIRFPEDLEKQEMSVVMRIESRYQDRIRADSTASIETQGLLGDKFIYVTMGSSVQPIIPDKGIITVHEAASIFALADKAGDIMENISQAAKSINDIFSSMKGKEGESDFKTIVSSLRKTIEQVEKGKGLIHALIYESNGQTIVEDLSRTMKGIGDIVSKADEEGETSGVIVNLRHATADLRALMASIRRGEGSLGMLITDPALYNDLRALVGRVNRNKLLRAVIRSTIQENERQVLK